MPTAPRFAGVELYFKDLAVARRFYSEALGLAPEEERPEHHIKFSLGDGFLCLERTGVENYPSEDKAVIFLEVGDLASTLRRIPASQLVRDESRGNPPWAAIRDPEGHTVLLSQRRRGRTK